MTSLIYASLGRDNGSWSIADINDHTFQDLGAIWAEALSTGGYEPSWEYQQMLEDCDRWYRASYEDSLFWDIQCFFEGRRPITWSTRAGVDDEMISVALDNGINEMLDAYYKGVPAEDIAPDWIDVADYHL